MLLGKPRREPVESSIRVLLCSRREFRILRTRSVLRQRRLYRKGAGGGDVPATRQNVGRYLAGESQCAVLVLGSKVTASSLTFLVDVNPPRAVMQPDRDATVYRNTVGHLGLLSSHGEAPLCPPKSPSPPRHQSR